MNIKLLLRRLLLSAVVIAMPLTGVFANTTTTVTQVSTAVTVADGVDYHITSSTPFVSGGTVDLTKGGTATVILDGVVPSKAANLLATYVRISGERAVRGTNCDIRIHSQGTIIYPYTEKDQPLTVYSEQNYGGTAVSDFGLEDAGGFMNTLTDAKLNNKIRSFKLRRGFMVTFSTRAGGYGYSRCFIAADEDMNVPTLPAILDKSITSYRIFKWNDNSKKGLANNTNIANNTLLRTTSCYSFGPGGDTGLDFECIRHHIHEAWPSIAEIGANGYTTSNPTVKTNNEPANSADDQPATVDQVLANWQALMATGKRLCSPSYYDGGYNWQKAFMDSIDARGWRCDVMDLHCYWPENSFNNLAGWYRDYHRPIWISEWCWGASWNNNGAFANGVTEADVATHINSIINKLEGWDYVERYFYWDSERDPSHLIKNGSLTQAGQKYAALNSKVGYNASYQYVPTIPKSKGAPSELSIRYDKTTREASLAWHEPNGEYNQSMTVQRQLPGSNTWEDVADIDLQEAEADYTYTVKDVERGTKFRIKAVYADGKESTNAKPVEATPDEMAAGDAITVDGKTMYAGGNILVNGDFAMGLYGWTDGLGNELSQPNFEAIAKEGYDGKPFLQAYSHGGAATANSLRTSIDLDPNSTYYLSGAVNFPNGAGWSTLTISGENEKDTIVVLPAAETWMKFGSTFNTGNRNKGTLSFRWLSSMAEYGELSIQKLFATKDEAVADGAKADALRAEAEKSHPTFAAKEAEADAEKEAADNKALNDEGLSGKVSDYTFSAVDKGITDANIPGTTYAWTKAGTYTGGTQGAGSLDGTACWTARWTGVPASVGKGQTLEVRQQLTSDLMHGIYMLSVDAAADHYCISDQHGYLSANGDSIVTPTLSWAVADIPTIDVAKRWQTLTTAPVYLDSKTPVAVGFASSKDGAVDNAWKPFGEQKGTGDQREGSWYATNFRLVHLPVYRAHTDSSHWRTLCLPYDIKATDNLKLYTIAGKNADGSRIYLKEVSEVEGGFPCIALTADTVQIILEEGTPTTRRRLNTGLSGIFDGQTTPRNAMILKDGYWQTQKSSDRAERAYLAPYSAYISNSNFSKLEVLDSWDGLSLNVDEKPAPTGINAIENGAAKNAPAVYFDINGRRVSTPVKGLYIRVQGNKVEKIIIK